MQGSAPSLNPLPHVIDEGPNLQSAIRNPAKGQLDYLAYFDPMYRIAFCREN